VFPQLVLYHLFSLSWVRFNISSSISGELILYSNSNSYNMAQFVQNCSLLFFQIASGEYSLLHKSHFCFIGKASLHIVQLVVIIFLIKNVTYGKGKKSSRLRLSISPVVNNK